ncbi:hypothetical protein GFS31_07610 [Leptolyngbya sp. BL0902]|nr:hypothetical protein GFS31_07610 [Leptolyngbya sp. BL0902]
MRSPLISSGAKLEKAVICFSGLFVTPVVVTIADLNRSTPILPAYRAVD